MSCSADHPYGCLKTLVQRGAIIRPEPTESRRRFLEVVASRVSGSVSARWLALREPADHAARSTTLVTELRRHLPENAPLAVHDLGCGTGSMLRWLAPQLPGPQRWTGHDRDKELLAALSASTPVRDSRGVTVTVAFAL